MHTNQNRGFWIPAYRCTRRRHERRLRLALGLSISGLTRVMVRLGDANGPRGGEDKFCKIHVALHASPGLIEDPGADLYAVIDRAAERAGRNVGRRLGPLQEIDQLIKQTRRCGQSGRHCRSDSRLGISLTRFFTERRYLHRRNAVYKEQNL